MRGDTMRLRVERLSEGPGPGEFVVGVTTSTGATEQVVVYGMEDDTIEVGHPLASDETKRLVELPRESLSGKWRVWVPRDSVIE